MIQKQHQRLPLTFGREALRYLGDSAPQRQVGTDGKQLALNRPDLQYTLDGKRYYVEWDKPLCSTPGMTKRGDQHAVRIRANDTSAKIGATLLLLVVGARE